MPELPEVETVRRGLEPVLSGALITDVEQRRPDLRFPFPQDFAVRLRGRRIVALGRRAKYLLIDLDDMTVLIAHLGMSGSFRVETDRPSLRDSNSAGMFYHARCKDEKHDHVVFHLDTLAGPQRVVYNDPRRFGFMDLADRRTLSSHPRFSCMGVEPTGNALSPALLSPRFKGRRTPLKALLLDQSVIAGLGNIYVCEALWRAKLSPTRSAGSLITPTGRPSRRLHALVEAVRMVIEEAIAAGGSSLRDHIRADGTLGYFQHSFSVYDREGKACPRPDCSGKICRIVQSGRSSFFCNRCQR